MLIIWIQDTYVLNHIVALSLHLQLGVTFSTSFCILLCFSLILGSNGTGVDLRRLWCDTGTNLMLYIYNVV